MADLKTHARDCHTPKICERAVYYGEKARVSRRSKQAATANIAACMGIAGMPVAHMHASLKQKEYNCLCPIDLSVNS